MGNIAVELSAEIHEKIGDMYLQVGNKDKAAEYYKKALKIKPELTRINKKLEKEINKSLINLFAG